MRDVAWLAPDGREMTDEAWNADFVRSLGMLLPGTAIEETNERGEPITGDTLLILLNAHSDKVPFTLPDTGDPSALARSAHASADQTTTDDTGHTGSQLDSVSSVIGSASHPFASGGRAEAQFQWMRLMDTMTPQAAARQYRGGMRYPLQGRSVAVFQMTPPIRERRRSATSTAVQTRRTRPVKA